LPGGGNGAGWGGGIGFDWYFGTKGFQAFEFRDRAAMLALGVGRIADAQGHGVGAGDAALEPLRQQEVEGIGGRGFSGCIRSGRAETGSEEAGFEAGGAEDGLLGEGDALDGEEFLGVNGFVEVDGVVLEAGDLLDVFETDDGISGGREAVFASVLRGTGLAFRRSGTG
jgi:hypothetical protein